MKRVSIKLLGRCEITSPTGFRSVPASTKTALLLARIAMAPGQAQDRRRLTELLWPDRGEPQALASLRQMLWTLRKDLGDLDALPVVADRSSVRLDPTAVDVDTILFEDLIRTGTPDALQRAAELYRGDFLEEVDLHDEDGYAPFLFERQRLRSLYLSCLKTLIGQRAAAGQTESAVEMAQKALSLDPLQEDVQAALIRLHLARGELGAARSQYESCRDTLRRDLGIAPSTEIEALRQSFGSLPGQGPAKATLLPRAPVIVGTDTTAVSLPLTLRRAPHVPAILGAAAVALIALFVATQRSELPLQAAALDSRPSLVVLPFADQSPNATRTDFATGLSDSLINDLSKISGMLVISAETSRSITEPGIPPETQAEALDVAYAVSGAIRQERGGVNVSVDVVQAGTGNVVWSRRYDQQGEDLFGIQDDMVRGIASALNVPLNDREIRTVNRVPTSNLEARDYFLRAEYQTIGLGEADSLRRALASYQRAFELDPDFAEAYAGYARIAATVWRRDFSEIMSGAVARHRAYEAAGKAMLLDPENARAYEVLSIIQAVDGEHQIAVRSARQAVDFQPGDAESHANLATVLYFAGDLDGAAAEVGIARRLNPGLSTDLRLTSAMVNFARHQYPDAIAELNGVLQSVPRSDLVLEHLAAAYAYMGDLPRAKALATELKSIVPITNLGFYEVLSENIGTPEQTAHFIEGLRRAGIPEWPYDDRRSSADRLTRSELQSLIAGPLWTGQLANGVAFIQDFDKDGSFAYGSTTSLLTGRAEVRGDRLCQVIDGYLLNRPSCGFVYRNAAAAGRPDQPYAYVSIDAVKYFSVTR